MRLETFHGRDVASVHLLARQALGDDAMILETRALDGRHRGIEIVAAPAADLHALMQLVRPKRTPGRSGLRPRIVALVGPTGAGKTTTVAKLATHADAYGSLRVGLLTLDTHRAAGFEQLQAYADAAGLSCAVAYDSAEAQAALRTMQGNDVIIVDTAGRGPTINASQDQTRSILASLRPDEVHLCVPATMRLDLVERVRADHRAMRPTHAILTKLDEVPSDRTIAALASLLSLPMQWVTNGQNVPRDLVAAAQPILSPLGLAGRAGAAA
jgi:flagellar biosynthesis protein FlhF